MTEDELFDAMYDSVIDGDVDRAVALAEQPCAMAWRP